MVNPHDKFKCHGCGKCCKTFNHHTSETYPTPCFNEGPLIHYTLPRLKIFDFERHAFPAENLVPCSIVFDLKSNRVIVLDYTINTDPCPNLDDKNLCTVYEKRPLICRQFPSPYLMISSLSSAGRFQAFFGKCGADLPLPELKQFLGFAPDAEVKGVNPLPMLKQMYKRYGEGCLAGIAATLLFRTHIEFLAKAEKEGHIKMAKEGYDMKALVRRMDHVEWLDISALFVELGERPPQEKFGPAYYEELKKMLA